MSSRITAVSFEKAARTRKLVMLTAYTARMAELADPHCDALLVGDSLAQVVYGYPTTLQATVPMMIEHAKAVVRGSTRALVVVDLPFRSYEASPQVAFDTAARIVEETGCGAIKLEGGTKMAETIAYLVDRGIPVMAHVGLTPQAIHVLGSYRSRGHDNLEYDRILADAEAVAQAGAFSIVIEAVERSLADTIVDRVDTPTIGIGASASCSGQVLVVDDLLGITERTPRFVERYAEFGEMIASTIAAYADDTKSGNFPLEKHLSIRP